VVRHRSGYGDAMAKDLILEVLKQIRDEAKKTNPRLEKLEQTTDSRLERLEQRQADTEVRLATELVAVAGAVRELRDTLLEDRNLRRTVDAHEKRIAALEQHAH
jgi:DNA repair exonuclease SbcCD ATPase subunit